MAEDLGTEIKIGADASGVEAGVNQAKRSIASLGKSAADAGEQGGKGLEKIGAGGDKAAKDVDRATKNMAAGLQRQIAAMEAGGTATRQYQESLARLRGADVNVLKPLLDQLDAARTKTVALDRAQEGLGKSFGTLGGAASFAKSQIAGMLGSLTAGAFIGFVKSINDGIDALNDIKDATGASIENISALEDVGKRTGASFETVGSILVKFNKVLSEATPKSDTANALKAIGLEAEALKKIDPAEALRQTAVALSNYADDANKARLIQELFGKSVKEAAPFLTDLAEKGELVAKVTTKQAEEAEKFNKELFAMQANATDAARFLTGPLIEGINETAKAFREGRAAGLSFWEVASRRYWGNVRDFYGMAPDDGKSRVSSGKVGFEPDYEPPSPPKERPSVNVGPSAAERAAAAAEAKRAIEERKKLLEEEAKAWAELNGLASNYYQELAKAQKYRANGTFNEAQYVQYIEQLIQKQPFAIALAKKEADALKDLAKAMQDAADARNKEREGIDEYIASQERASSQTVKAIEDRIAAMELEDEAATLAAATNISLAEAINRVRVARLREKRDGPTGVYEGSDEYDRLTNEIDGLNREADRLNRNDRNDRARDTTRKAKQDFDRYVEDTSRGLGDAIETAIFDGSKAGGEKMREVLQEALLRKPLRMLIDGVMNQVTGGALQLLGIGGGGGVAGGGGGGGLSNLASLGSSAYQFSQGTGALYSAYGAASAYMGIGNSAAAAYLSHPLAGIATNGTVSGLATSSAGAGLGGSTAAGGAGAGAGAGSLAAGGVAALIMLGVINALGGMRTETMIGSGLAGTLGGANPLTPWQEWREGGTLFDGPSFATHNPLEELSQRKAELQRLRDSGQGESNYAVGIQAVVTDLEKTTKGLAEQTEVFTREIGKGYKAYRTNVVDMANSLGLAGDSVKDFAYTLGAQDLNFQGLNPEQIQAKIAETFGKAGVDMAQQLLGTWKEVTDTVVNTYVTEQMTQASDGAFQTDTTVTKRMEYQASIYAKTGETAIQTLTRLSTSFNALNETADALGFGIQKGSLALADFSDKFIEAFGGLEKFSSTTSAYMQAYYSDEERRQALLRSGARQANRLGLDGVTAESLEQLGRDGIRSFVTGLTEGGGSPEEIRDAMDLANFLAPAFASVEAQTPVVQELSNVVDELTQSYQNAIKSLTGDRDSLAVEVLRAQGDEKGAKALERTQYLAQFAGLDDARRKEIETLYDGNMATRAYIQGIKDAATAQLDALAKLRADSLALIDGAAGKTDAAFAAYERAADKERERLQGTIDSVKAVFQAAEDGAKSFFGEVEAVAKFQGAEGRDFISQALASVQAGGGLPDGKDLSDAIAAVGKDFSATQFTSQAEADFQRLVVANELKGLQDISDDQLTEAEKQLKELEDQTRWAREQVDALRGIDSSVGTLSDAIQDLVDAYNEESRTRTNVAARSVIGTGNAIYDKKTGGGTTSTGAYFDAADMAEVARDVIAANGAAGKNSVLDALEGKGFTMPQYNEIFGLPPGTLEAEAKALGRPIFHNGTTYVPETGFALLQQGEAVIPAAYNPWANGGASAMGDSTAVVNEIRALRDDNRAQAGQLIRLQMQLNKVLKQWDGEGLPEEREITA